MIRVRVAPSSTGNLTISSARVALANYLFSKPGHGRMLLRLDDVEEPRSRPTQVDQIMQDLHWIGIEWQDLYRQSERSDLYSSAIERLKRDRLLYPCFESEEELKAKQEFRRKRNQPPIYDRAMLSLTAKQREDAEAGGKRPYWRLKLSGRTLEWKDLIFGPKRVILSTISDPILEYANGRPAPILASVVDDVDFGTTHILRGEDSDGNTAIQIELFEVLIGSRSPVRFGHLPGLKDSRNATSGERRAGQLALRALRIDGVEPDVIATCIAGAEARIGRPLSTRELAKDFQLANVATSQFDVKQMLALNRQALGKLDFATVVDRLPSGSTEAFWLAVRGSLDLLKEARGWWDVVAGTIVPPVIEGARGLLLTASSLLPAEPWGDVVWSDWIAELERATGLAGDALLVPLRLALTGEDSGPKLSALLPLIGRARAAGRLQIAAA